MLLIILLCIFITSDQVTAQSWNRRSTSIFNTPKFRVRAHDLFVRFLLLTTRMCIELHDFQGIPQECLWGSRGEQRVNHYQQVHAILGHEELKSYIEDVVFGRCVNAQEICPHHGNHERVKQETLTCLLPYISKFFDENGFHNQTAAMVPIISDTDWSYEYLRCVERAIADGVRMKHSRMTPNMPNSPGGMGSINRPQMPTAPSMPTHEMMDPQKLPAHIPKPPMHR